MDNDYERLRGSWEEHVASCGVCEDRDGGQMCDSGRFVFIAMVRQPIAGGCPNCKPEGSIGRCPMCFAATGHGCGHGFLCDGCANDHGGLEDVGPKPASENEIVLHEGKLDEIRLPAHFEVCERCEGKGKHTNPAIDGNGITSDEWNGPDWDDDSREAYLSGRYDVTCEECKGLRVVKTWDESRMTLEQRTTLSEHVMRLYADIQERASEAHYGY